MKVITALFVVVGFAAYFFFSAGGVQTTVSAEEGAPDSTQAMEALPEEVAPEQLAKITPDNAEVPPIIGISWWLEDIKNTGVIDNSHSTLTLGADGRASGHGGCNRFGGEAKIASDGTLSFGPMMATRMACAAEAMNNQEAKYLEALGEVAGWRLAETGLLHLTNAAGEDILRFSAEDVQPEETPAE